MERRPKNEPVLPEKLIAKLRVLWYKYRKIQPIYSFAWKKVKAEADKNGIPMDEREFHCRGEFKGVHKGRPNDEDLKAAAAFAKAVAAKG